MGFVNTPKLALPGSAIKGDGAGTWVAQWNQICANLEARLTKSGSGSPVGAVAGDYVGQMYYRTDTNTVYWCTLAGAIGTATWTGYASAAYLAVGTAIGEIPVHSSVGPLLTGAYKAHGNGVGDLALHSAAGPLLALAYRAVPATWYTTKNTTTIDVTAETLISSFSNIAVPGAPNGSKIYKVNAQVNVENTTGGVHTVTLRVRVGTLGTLADPSYLQQQITVEGSRFGLLGISGFRITPVTSAKLSLTLEAGGNTTIITGAPRNSYLEIEELLV